VDEVAGGGVITQGIVWRFDVEPQGYPIAGNLIVASASSAQAGSEPQKTVDGSGLDAQDGHSTAVKDMWQSELGAAEPVWIQYEFDKMYKLDQMLVWNYNADLESLVGFGLKNVTVQYSLDGAAWTDLGDFTFNQGLSTAGYKANTIVDLAGTVARYIRLVVHSSWGVMGRHGLSEVRFLYTPTRARQPCPASGATDVDTEAILSWRAGRDAASHEVYLSSDEQAVVQGTALAGAVNDNGYAAPGLELSTTYYWKVNEVNPAQALASWEGDVWSFTTRDSYVVDDFDSYTNDKDAGEAIWQTWADGFDTTDNGSQVGYTLDAHFAYTEWDVVHATWQSSQSMPFYYNNQGPSFSEAVRTFDEAQNWTRGGARWLVLYFYGDAANTVGQLYVKINNAKVPYDGPAEDLMKPFWVPWVIDLTSVATDLTTVKTLTIGVDNGGYGLLYFDDVRLCRVAPPLATEEVWIEAEAADSLTGIMKVYSDRPDASGGRYIAAYTNSSNDAPIDDAHPGMASYTLRLSGGTYEIIGRVSAPTVNDDSFWVYLDGATTNTANDASGWVKWGFDFGDAWHEVPVQSMDDANQTVQFTVPAGLYNLQVTYREDGAKLDALMITKQLQ
jgi:hypothetical protein